MTTTVVAGLAIISVVLLIAALAVRSPHQTIVDFFLHGGNLRAVPFVGTLLATNLSLGNMIYVCAIWGFFYGLQGLTWVAITIILLFTGYVIFAPRFKAYIEDRSNSGTVHEYIASSYGNGSAARRLRYAASTATVITVVLALVLEIHLAVLLLNVAVGGGTTPLVSVVFLISLVAVYASIGGFRTVVITDVVQFLTMLLALAAIALLFVQNGWGLGAEGSGGASFLPLDWSAKVGISALGFMWLLVGMDAWQRASATRSIDTSIRGAVIGGFLLTLMVVLFASIGMIVNLHVVAAVPSAVAESLSGGLFPFNDILLLGAEGAHGLLLGVMVIGLLMAAISTADTFLIVAGHSLVSDILLQRTRQQEVGALGDDDQRSFGYLAKGVVVALSFVVVLAWLALQKFDLLGDPLNLFYVAYSVQFALFPAVLARAFRRPGHPSAALAGLLCGVAASLAVGLVAMTAYGREAEGLFLMLRADQWLALLPLVPVIVGGSVFVLGSLILMSPLAARAT